jgi:hypothetical protein
MTVRQIVEKFGGDGAEPDWTRLSTAVKAAYDRASWSTWIDVVHVIQPNDAARRRAPAREPLQAFSRCYYEKGRRRLRRPDARGKGLRRVPGPRAALGRDRARTTTARTARA